MPIYIYQASSDYNSCEHCREQFEVTQSMKDDPLSQCEFCGNEIRRIIQPVGFSRGNKGLLSDKNIKEKGFTKLVNEGGGKFRKI